jgi:ferredoxin
VFVSDSESLVRLIWNPFCAQNLTGYLVKTPAIRPVDEAKKIGICVKGCDSQSLVALIQEHFIERDQVTILGFPCRGVVDWRRVRLQLPDQSIVSASVVDDHLMVESDRGPLRLPLDSVLARRCLRCAHPNPLLYDVLIGEMQTPRVLIEEAYHDVTDLERLSLEEKLAYWTTELDRCIRCYACRNACPLCVCQDRCIAETRDPRWLSQRMNGSEKFLFHMIHALHLAGRCTECGECERVCPMEIPVALMKEKLNQITRELFNYRAGVDPEAVPPLLTYSPDDKGM